MSAPPLTLHVITDAFPPTRAERHLHGGLEAWTCNLADRASGAGIEVIVYVCGFSCGIPDAPEYLYEVVDVAGGRAPWEGPLREGASPPQRIAAETQRLDFLLLRNAVRERVAARRGGTHWMLSNYALGPGYLATQVAGELDLPHVAVVVGTDFSRGAHNRLERQLFEEVCRRADLIVCKSTEQARGVATLTPAAAVRVIRSGLEAPLRPRERAPSGGAVRLFSDGGFSFHKGSAVLLDSFLALRAEGLPLALTVCGAVSELERDYWAPRLAEAERRAHGAFAHLGHVELPAVEEQLLGCDVYASSSLGEGSARARLRALCAGVPLVTTDCGEFAHDVDPLSHVRVVATGDAGAFRQGLRELCLAVGDGRLEIDWGGVERHRRRFAREREWGQWRELLETLRGAGRRVA